LGPIAIAADITPLRDRASISIAGPSIHPGLMHWEVIEDRPGVDWLVDRLVELKFRHSGAPGGVVAFCIDGKGPTASLITELDRKGIKVSADPERPFPGDLIVTGPQDMANAFGMFVDAATYRHGRHRGQQPLDAAVAGATTRDCGDGGRAWGRKGSDSIAPLVALTLAHWAWETRSHRLVDPGPPNIW
jgi:hypothetical protein